MKSHIDKLEQELCVLQQNSTINDSVSSPDSSAVSVENKTGLQDDGYRKNPKKKKSNLKQVAKSLANQESKIKTSKREKTDSSESGEDIFVYIEHENDPMKNAAQEQIPEKREINEAARDSDDIMLATEPVQKSDENLDIIMKAEETIHGNTDEVNLGSFPGVNDEMNDQEEGKKEHFECNDDVKIGIQEKCFDDIRPGNGLPKKDKPESQPDAHDFESTNPDCDAPDESTDVTFAITVDNTDNVFPLIQENVCEINEVNGIANGNCLSGVEVQVDTHQIANERAFTPDKQYELEEVNAELKERVAELEEQLWLAAEERRNLQAVLELQKEKALKNLAFKFEEINRKTLREFKGIFEYRLQELNDEKIKLQEKLDNYNSVKDLKQQGCESCELLKARLAEAEAKAAQLSNDKDMFKRRCRKLSGDLGKVKKVLGSIAASDDSVLVDRNTQTDNVESGRINVGVQCEKTPETSLNDLHDDIRDIATRVSTISSHILTEQRKWSQGEEFFNENDAARSFSSNNESGIESLRLSPTKTRSDHDGSEIGDSSNASISETSDRNEKALNNNFQNFLVDEQNQYTRYADEGIFSNDVTQLSTCDIERHLLKIHAKYLKISKELENFAIGQLGGTVKQNTGKAYTDLNGVELDPEIKMLVDDVNRKYNEYFKGKIVF